MTLMINTRFLVGVGGFDLLLSIKHTFHITVYSDRLAVGVGV